jgi:Carboxypeptidase regulatory-like domain
MKCIAVLLTIVSTAGIALAQNATVTGTITDPSGAIVAGATIEVKNPQNGQVYSSVSTQTGNYTVAAVPVGTYEMSVSSSGFKTYNRTRLVFAAGQVARLDVTMEVGASTESITITAETPLLKTENSEVAHNVTVSQLNTLPVLQLGGAQNDNTSGFRDPYALARMVPGISYSANTTMVVNGTPDDTVQFRLDGQTAQNTGGLRQYTAIGQPSTDALQEVVVQTSNYAAEFGTAGGAVFNATTKSGTNQFHGSVYDYVANEVLNSAQPYTNLRSPTRRHNYGFTIGGPVRIPKVYDGTNKTFFFFAWERFREDITVRTSLATVPTPEYRAGDFSQVIAFSGAGGVPLPLRVNATTAFLDPLGRGYNSGTIFDPSTTRDVTCPVTGASCSATAAGSAIPTRDAFPGNRIPVSRFDPVALKVLGLVPLPTGPNAASGQLFQNFQNPYPSQTRSQIPSIKLNHSINANHRLAFYYQKTGLEAQYTQQNGNAEGLPSPVTASRGSFIYTHTYRFTWDYSVTPTMLLNVGVGWFHHNFSDRAPVLDYDAEKELGLKGATLKRNFPNFNVGGVNPTGGMNNLGPFASIQGTGGSERRPSAVVNLTQVRGNHTVKLGSEWRGERLPTTNFGASNGAYTFNTNATIQTALQATALSQGSTGFAFASFVLGGVSQYTLAVPASVHTGKKQYALFLQDTWKVKRNLTLDYGLRWDYGTYSRERWGRNSNFSASTANPAAFGRPGAQIFEATCNCRFAENYPYAVGPRLGLAYQWNPKTVIRAGFGVVYTGTGAVGGQTAASATQVAQGFGEVLGQLQNGIPASVQPRFPVFDPSVGQTPGTVVAGPNLLDPNAGRPARQYQWSFGVQREVSRNLVVEASYVANRGVWWSAPTLSAANVTSEAILNRYGFRVGNAADATLLTRQLGQLTAAQRTDLTSRGVGAPYAGYGTGATAGQTVRQSLLPFPQYTSVFAPQLAPLGKTWYDSLQVTANKRFSRGLSLNANYTLSKNLDQVNLGNNTNASTQTDVFNRKLAKNLSANDIPQQLRITFEYVLPNLRNSRIKGLSNRFVAYALSGWGTAWNLQYQSAPILWLPASVSPNNLAVSQWLGRGPGPAQWNGQSLFSTNWTDYDGKVHNEPLDVNCRCYDPTKTVVLNPGAWANVPDGQWANNFSSIRQYRNIRQPSENANLSRNFKIKEGIDLNVRVEFQNVFNRTRLTISNASTTGFQSAPTTFASGANRGLYSGGFGTVLPLSGTPGSRAGLFVGRLTF